MTLRGQITRYHVGETVRIRVKVTDPETYDVLQPTSGQVEWWAPGTDRRTDPPTATGSLTWRPEREDLVLYQPTDGWAEGRWEYKVTVIGTEYRNVHVSTITLNP